MKDSTIKAVLIVFIVGTMAFFVLYFSFKFLLPQTMLAKLVPFIQEFEGGLSRDSSDSASSNPAPWSHNGQTGWHTNKGVTYSSFVGNASRGGYQATEKNFFEMPDEIWMKILKVGYMGAYPLAKINHLPRIQAVIITWSWGSGTSGSSQTFGSESRLAHFQRAEMGIKDTNITKTEIIENFRKNINPINERAWFLKLCEQREADFRRMSTFSVHGNGWLRRLNAFRELFS